MANDFLVVETITEEKARQLQAELHVQRAAAWETAGNTVVHKSNGQIGIVGKNALTGEDDLNPEAITWAWAEPLPTGEDTLYIEDIPIFNLTGTYEEDYVRRVKPEEWTTPSADNDFNSQFDEGDY